MMPLDVTSACQELELDAPRCRKLKEIVREVCEGGKTKRKRSLWQECIASRRKGKKFDPQAIKELSKEYKAGRCP